MKRDMEYSPPGEEFNPPASEFIPPAREHSPAGREFGQNGGTGTPAQKRRRIPGIMLTAAAVVTAAVTLSAPAAVEFPQPENFTAEYRAYLNEIVETCEAEDPAAVHQLGSDPMADEFWTECMEPYGELLHQRGFSRLVFYDGEEMTAEPGPGRPALYFWHGESTPEEIMEQNVLQYHTQLTYCRDGSRRGQGVWGTYYSASYGMSSFSQENDSSFDMFWFDIFWGEMTQTEDLRILYQQGTWQSYEPYGYGYGYGDEPPDTPQLVSELTGTFYNETLTTEDGILLGINYLENGTWTQHFHRGAVETQVVDGSIVLNKYLEPEPAEEPGLYKGITVWSPNRLDGGTGWGSPDKHLTLEELLYHSRYTRAR